MVDCASNEHWTSNKEFISGFLSICKLETQDNSFIVGYSPKPESRIPTWRIFCIFVDFLQTTLNCICNLTFCNVLSFWVYILKWNHIQANRLAENYAPIIIIIKRKFQSTWHFILRPTLKCVAGLLTSAVSMVDS